MAKDFFEELGEAITKFFTEDTGKACRWMICRGVSASRLIRG